MESRAQMYRRFKRHGVELTPEQWMVLVRLWQNEGVDAVGPRRPDVPRFADDESDAAPRWRRAA